MKKMIWKSVAIMAIGLFTFAACDTPEQSEFTVESITTKATIKGQVYYHTGMDANGKGENITYPAGKKVYIDVPVKVYKNDPTVSGFKTFEAVIDANGFYTLTFKVPQQGIDLSVAPGSGTKLRFETFDGEQTYATGKKETGFFQIPDMLVSSLTANDGSPITTLASNTNYAVNSDAADGVMSYQFIVNDKLDIYDASIKVYGYISKAKSTVVPSNPVNQNDRKNSRDSIAGDTVVITVQYIGENRKREYIAVSGTKGRYEISLPIKSIGETVVTIGAQGRDSRPKDPFTGYYWNTNLATPNYSQRTFTGYFEDAAGGISRSYFLKPIQQAVKLEECKMQFIADPEQYKVIEYTDCGFDNGIANW